MAELSSVGGGGGGATVLVVGSVNADIVVTMPRLPVPGETLSGGGGDVLPGGKGANQAVAASKSDTDTKFTAILAEFAKLSARIETTATAPAESRDSAGGC